MNLLDLFGSSAFLLIGVSLGLIGGGGSILTLPVLVYIMNINPVLATAYSLFLVGTTSGVGAIHYIRERHVHFGVALAFSVPSLTAVFMTRRYLLPALPDEFFSINGFTLSKEVAIMFFFALIMLAAAVSMLRNTKNTTSTEPSDCTLNYPVIALEGAVIGVVTGIVGAGGGFLIIPALVLLARLPMKTAIGTSLLIIMTKSLIGFLGDLPNQPIQWPVLLPFTALSIVGIFIGSYISRYISTERLKTCFGWFIICISVFIIIKGL